MPRASKAVDAAKQLSRKVAAVGAAKPTPKTQDKTAKAAAKSPSSAKSSPKATKDARPAMEVKTDEKAGPAATSAAQAKAPRAAKKTEVAKKPAVKAPAKPVEKAVKAVKAPKPARRLEGAGADKFFEEQRVLLQEERISYLAQAADLKAEADQLAQEMEPGDIQFDDESGEGATAAVDRERDLALSAQARVEVDEIDHALAKLDGGSYGICEGCGQPVPRARLKALPHARLCVACKSGGLSRR